MAGDCASLPAGRARDPSTCRRARSTFAPQPPPPQMPRVRPAPAARGRRRSSSPTERAPDRCDVSTRLRVAEALETTLGHGAHVEETVTLLAFGALARA